MLLLRKFSLLIVLAFILSMARPVLAYMPSDPLYPAQTYLQRINIESAWDKAKGDGVVVAVIDTGVDVTHPDLQFNIWKNIDEIPGNGLDDDHNGYIDDVNGWDFVTSSADPRPKLDKGYDTNAISHGTAIAGLIAAVANNGQGITGVAFNAKIMPLRILDNKGSGTVEHLIKAIDYAVNNGADVINLSLVGYDYSDNLAATVKRVHNQGVIIVAASGNTDAEIKGINLDLTPAYPACYGAPDEVIAVSSVNSSDVKSVFSNFGITCLDLTAPGENIYSLAFYQPTSPDFSSYYRANWSGTSFATALVTGAAALVKSQAKFLTPDQAMDVLKKSADSTDPANPNYRGLLGAGRINVGRALSSEVLLSLPGRLVKLANNPAVYYVDTNNSRHLFVNEVTYWSWYQGTWREQPIQNISQTEFDNLNVGQNITVRPGSNLIYFSNSPRLYAVTSGAVIRPLSDEVAQNLYGDNFRRRVILIQDGFELNYTRGQDLANYEYPDGSLIQYAGSEDVWYLEKGYKRPVDTAGLTTNNFNLNYLIRDVSADIFYNAGQPLSGWEKNIYTYKF